MRAGGGESGPAREETSAAVTHLLLELLALGWRKYKALHLGQRERGAALLPLDGVGIPRKLLIQGARARGFERRCMYRPEPCEFIGFLEAPSAWGRIEVGEGYSDRWF